MLSDADIPDVQTKSQIAATPASTPARAAMSRADVEAALERVVAQADFQASPRLSAFLRFVVGETLEGRGDALKAALIAVSVYGRDENFDPQTNSIVRVEATRLRRLLERYYGADGAADPVRIVLPRGSYAPVFEPTHLPVTPRQPAPEMALPADDALANDAPQAAVPAPAAPVSRGVGRGMWLTAFGAAATLAAMLAFAPVVHNVIHALMPHQAPVVPAPGAALTTPSLGLSVETRGALDSHARDDVASALERAMGQFDDVRVRVGEGAQDADYALDVSLATEASALVLRARLSHRPSGEVLWSYRSDLGSDSPKTAQMRDALEMIAGSVGRPFGLIFSDQRRRLASATDRRAGFGCIIQAYDHLARPTKDSFARSRACLEGALRDDPEFGAAAAMLSRVLVEGYVSGAAFAPGEEPLDLAVGYAARAVALQPYSQRAQASLFTAQFAARRYEAAFDLARRALERDPRSVTLSAPIGAAHVLRGDYAEGRAMLSRVVLQGDRPGGSYGAYIFLAAHMQGDVRGAHLWALKSGAATTPLGMLGRIIVAHSLGDLDEVGRWRARLASAFPAFHADIAAGLMRYGMTDEVRARLLADLAEAGVSTGPASQ